jgi:type II secretory pathway pseudopilin PulG
MPSLVVFFVVAVVALVIVAGLMNYRAEKKRREALAALAQRLGLRFDPAQRSGAPGWAEPFELFKRGHRYGTKNHLSGSWAGLVAPESQLQPRLGRVEVPLDALDYTYYTESHDSKGGHSRTYYTRTVLALDLPQSFPGITIKPDSALREFFEFIGGADIDFESDEFNKRFYVWSDDRKFAYAVVHARMMEFLLGTRQTMRDLHLQIVGSRAIFFRERTLDAAGVEQLMQFAAAFYAQIPDYVKKDHARV